MSMSKLYPAWKTIAAHAPKQLQETSMDKIQAYWKAVVAFVGSALLVWNQLAPGLSDIMPASWQHPIAVVVAVLTVVATYGVPNKASAPQK